MYSFDISKMNPAAAAAAMEGYGDYQHIASRSAFTEIQHQSMGPYAAAAGATGATAPYTRSMPYGAAAPGARRPMTNSSGPDGHPSFGGMGPMGQARHFAGYFMNSPMSGHPPIYDRGEQISSLSSKEGNYDQTYFVLKANSENDYRFGNNFDFV